MINALLAEGKIDLLIDKIRVGFLEVEPINNEETYKVSTINNHTEFEGSNKRIDEEQFSWEEELESIFTNEEQPRRNQRMIDGNAEWEKEKRVITCTGCYSEVDLSWKFCPSCGKTVKEREINEEIKQ
ncbi:MAG: hypothetical protein ACTSYA_03625 [Candidatus Kariarchaeaceae archaeon]